MPEFTHTQRERVSRQRAAERLVDIAYALAGSAPYELRLDGQRMRVPIADHVLLEWKSRSADNRLEFELELTWSASNAEAPTEVASRSVT